MPLTLPWIIAFAAGAVLALAALWFALQRRPPRPEPLPTEWMLNARPVFSTDERRVYRQLREALPHHVVLSKLPLVRFCQPVDPQEVRYWYDMLGSIHVTFAICSGNGRVLAAIDLDTDRGNSQRVLQIKHAVLNACRVRYLRCPVDRLPSVAELQMLVPQNVSSRGPQPAPSGDGVSRREQSALWQDSTFFHDSFFAPDSRLESSSQFGGMESRHTTDEPVTSDGVGGVAVNPPRYGTHRRH